MADFKLRLPDPLATEFDAWASSRGGRSPALRQLIRSACESPKPTHSAVHRPGHRPAKLTVRLTADDAHRLDGEAHQMGLTRNAWLAALARRRLTGALTFSRTDEVALVAIQAEVHRIGVNINQIARALNTAVLEGQVLDVEVRYLEDLRTELRVHLSTLKAAFEGNLAYWDVGG